MANYGVTKIPFSPSYLAAALWCCSFVRLWLWSCGPVVAHTFHSFPFFFHASYISLFLLSYCPLRLWVLVSIVRWFCISAIMQFTVLLVFGFVLSCFCGALAEVLGSYNFESVPNTTTKQRLQLVYSKICCKIRCIHKVPIKIKPTPATIFQTKGDFISKTTHNIFSPRTLLSLVTVLILIYGLP